MRFSVILLLLLTQALPAQTNKPFSIGQYDQLFSTILNRNREIIVHVPPLDNNTITPKTYPVLFLLDGDALFTKTVGILDHLSSAYGGNKCPEMIVVGIKHPNRMQDLLPVISKDNPDNNDHFTEFLEKELIPYIDKNYPTQPYRVLAGHSLGGLRAANTLLYHPQIFNAYIALDPSLGHDMNLWSDKADSLLKTRTLVNKSLFVAMAQTMPKHMDTAAINKDTSGASRHMRAIMRFSKSVQARQKGIQFNWKYYPDEAHAGVTFLGMYDGLCALFAWYENKESPKVFDTGTSTLAATKIISDHYNLISQKMGYTVLPQEQYVNGIIDYLADKNMNRKALAFGELNARNYPESPSAKQYLEELRWSNRKSLDSLLPFKSVQEICDLCISESKKEKPDYNISENRINVLGYHLLEEHKTQDALLVFKVNVDLYPTASNTWDSYGECLVMLGREAEGLKAYRKALELNPGSRNAANMIKKLEEK